MPAESSWELGRMEVDESITLILKTRGIADLSEQKTREMAKPAMSSLRCLALAVAHASTAVQQGVCGMDEYCPLYYQRRKELRGQKVVQSGDREAAPYFCVHDGEPCCIVQVGSSTAHARE